MRLAGPLVGIDLLIEVLHALDRLRCGVLDSRFRSAQRFHPGLQLIKVALDSLQLGLRVIQQRVDFSGQSRLHVLGRRLDEWLTDSPTHMLGRVVLRPGRSRPPVVLHRQDPEVDRLPVLLPGVPELPSLLLGQGRVIRTLVWRSRRLRPTRNRHVPPPDVSDVS